MYTPYNKINFLPTKGIKFNTEYGLKRSPSAGYSKMIIRRGNNNSLEKYSNKSFDFSTIKKQVDIRKLSSYKSTSNVFKTENNSSFYDINNINNTNSNISNINNITNNYVSNKTPSYYGSQLKERLIQDLKNNFSQDKIQKKKLLNVNVNINLNQNYSLMNNNNNSNTNNNLNNNILNNNNNNLKSLYHLTENPSHSNIFQNKTLFNDRELPTKLYTNPSKIIHRRNDSHNNFLNHLNVNPNLKSTLYSENNVIFSQNNTENSKLTETQNNQKLNEQFYDLQIKLEKLLKENKTHSKSRNYNIIKMIFEEGIKILSDNVQRNFLKIILVKYHELVIAYNNENKSLRQSSEHLQNQYLTLDKNYIDLQKNLIEKEKEIEKFKKEIQDIKIKTNDTINNSQITFCAKDDIKDNTLLQSKNSLLISKNSLLQSKNSLLQSKNLNESINIDNNINNFNNTININENNHNITINNNIKDGEKIITIITIITSIIIIITIITSIIIIIIIITLIIIIIIIIIIITLIIIIIITLIIIIISLIIIIIIIIMVLL